MSIEGLIGNSPQDVISYIIIALVIISLSPYGIFVIRSIIAMATGRTPPKIIRRGAKPAKSEGLEAIADLEQVATTRIRKMSTQITELQSELADITCQIEQLQHENNALKNHIREMETEAKTGQDNNGPTADGPNADSDYAILGLPETRRDEIRAAFIKTTKNAHPDQGGDSEKFKEIVAAYERLMSQG